MEIKDDLKDTFIEAIGRSTYFNSNVDVLSYVAIFENMWNQSELHQHISQAYERLKIDDTMHKEFINVAAHILRNPIQPILGLTVRETVFQNLQSDKSQDKTMNLAVYAILIICWTSNTVEYG